MGSIDSSSSSNPPKTWIPLPYMNSRDCSEGFCSLYCPQWCYIIAPPSPSFDSPQPKSSSALSLSPLVIAIIGILVSAFLLVSYFTVMSKYCGNESRRRSRIREDHGSRNQEFEGTLNHSIHEPWHVVMTGGLDEALIKSLRVCKYKNGDVTIEGTDCAVCLSEFEEDESLRLLPKCSHAFHLPCIDTWLKSHSNCPLCRANVVPMNAATQHQMPPAVSESLPSNSNEEMITSAQDSEEIRDTVVDIGVDDSFHQTVIRSVSMDCLRYNNRVSVADILHMDEEDEHAEGWLEANETAGSSKQSGTETHSFTKEPTRHVAMKRSFSSGRLFPTRPARSRHTIIPL